MKMHPSIFTGWRLGPSWLAPLSMTCLVAVVVAASSYETGKRCAIRLRLKDDHSSVIGNELCVGPRRARGVSNVRSLGS